MIEIKFKNSDFLIAVKPANSNFHCEGDQLGFVEQLKTQLALENLKNKQSVLEVKKVEQKEVKQKEVKLEQELQLYPVHRLDKMTSGLIIFALNKATAQDFQRMFESREIDKFYIAISNKKPKKKQGAIKGKMTPARNGSWKFSNQEGVFASTHFISVSTQPNERLFLLKPLTGRTHQLRVALKSIAAPIAGDSRYNDKNEAILEQRGYLHAYGIRFAHKNSLYEFVCLPDSGERFMSQACLAKLASWAKPWTFFKG